jgi:ABC-type sulfate/molybdate transport systems ATPase subunit
MLGHGMLEVDVTVPRAGFEVTAAFTVAPGEALAIIGPSGAGKTTLLESVAGLVTPRRGTVRLRGRTLFRAGACEVAVSRRHVGLVRQRPALFPHLDVRANILYAERRGPPEQTCHVIARLGLEELLSRRTRELSGGQAHRVAIARVLAAECEALLLDEPFDGLDRDLREELMAVVAELAAELGLPLVVVTHMLEDVAGAVDRLLVLAEGRVLQQGRVEEVLRRPLTRRVARLVGYRAFAPDPRDPSLSLGVHPDAVVPLEGRRQDVVVVTGQMEPLSGSACPPRVRVAFGSDAVELLARNVVQHGAAVEVGLLDPPRFRGEELHVTMDRSVERAQR